MRIADPSSRHLIYVSYMCFEQIGFLLHYFTVLYLNE
jgi:hypothetical protein